MKKKKKKKLDVAPTCEQRRPSRVAVSGCVGRECGMGFAMSVHPNQSEVIEVLNPSTMEGLDLELRLGDTPNMK